MNYEQDDIVVTQEETGQKFNNFYEKTRAVAPQPIHMPSPQITPSLAPKRKRNGLTTLLVLLLVFGTFITGVAGVMIGVNLDQNTAPQRSGGTQNVENPAHAAPNRDNENAGDRDFPLNLPTGDQLSAVEVFEKCNQGVVAITVEVAGQNALGQSVTRQSAGSGFIITADGYIVTNHHVVFGYQKVTVMLYNGIRYEATVVGSDELSDLAVLKIDGEDLFYLEFGASSMLRVGETVYTIGNPLGELANTFTDGMISALEREILIEGDHGNAISMNLLQTNAAISPGNSGGPLLNVYGQVVGVINAKSVREGVEGLGFAIPIDDAQPLIVDIIANGVVTTRAALNITATNFFEVRGSRQIPIEGAGVYMVVEDGAAYQAGVREEDLIIAINDIAISNTDDLVRALRQFTVGDVVRLTIVRDRNEIRLDVTLGPPMAVQVEDEPVAEEMP
ncbi:MAG: S1C family serine protease [Oscillospiraceae bacterium]|nr:S1C family serine protease [Oscillospiraceae bacterium]